VIDHREAEVGKGQLPEVGERAIDVDLTGLYSREEIFQTSFVHGGWRIAWRRPVPLPLALPVAWLIGLSLAWSARAELARSEVPLLLARPFLVAAAFAALVLGPVLGYFATLHGDWAYLYVVRWSRVPSAVDLLLVLFAAAQVPLAFAVAAPWAAAKRGAFVVRVSAVAFFVLVVLCAVFFRRLASSATYAQFHGGFGTSAIGKSSLGRGVLSSWAALLAGWGWAVHVLRRK